VRIRAERGLLADALTWVAQAIAKNPASPELAGVRLTAAGGVLTAKAYDYDSAHTATLDADVASEGECLVSGKFLRTIVAAMKGRDVELTLDGNLTIASGRATYRAQTMKVDNYPALPSLPQRVGEADAGDLAAAVAAVRHPIDDGSPHPQVRGLRIEGGNELEVLGMDRHRIARAVVPWKWDADLAVTIHSGAFETAVKGMSGPVALGFEDGLFGLSDATRAVTVRTYMEGFTPNWRDFLTAPDDVPSVSVEHAALKESLSRVRALDIADASAVSVAFGDGEVTIRGSTDGIGEGEEVIEAATDGSAVRGFNPRLLGDALAAIPGGPLTIRATPKGLWLIEPVEYEHPPPGKDGAVSLIPFGSRLHASLRSGMTGNIRAPSRSATNSHAVQSAASMRRARSGDDVVRRLPDGPRATGQRGRVRAARDARAPLRLPAGPRRVRRSARAERRCTPTAGWGRPPWLWRGRRTSTGRAVGRSCCSRLPWRRRSSPRPRSSDTRQPSLAAARSRRRSR